MAWEKELGGVDDLPNSPCFTRIAAKYCLSYRYARRYCTVAGVPGAASRLYFAESSATSDALHI